MEGPAPSSSTFGNCRSLPSSRLSYRRGILVPVCVSLLILQNVVNAFSLFLSMWTQGQVHVLNTAQNVELDCEFYAEDFNMFNNPVIWKKFQRQEQADVNIMGNILPPFFATGRFDVKLTSNPPRYRLRLKIIDLALEDSGNYTCEVRGPKSSIMAAVTHYIFVRAPVQGIYFTPENTTEVDAQATTTKNSLTQVSFVEGAPGRLRCVSIGGYPPPELSIYLGDRDISSQFSSTKTSASLHGARGLRLMVHQTERSSDHLTLTSNDDGLTLRCVAVVSGLGSNSTSVTVSVSYAPLIHCYPVSAYMGEKNVRLTCEVRAKPTPSALFWLIDVNGTAVTEGVVIDEYWTLVMDRTDGLLETQLFMRQATAASFRTYTLYAENGVAVTTADVTLTEKIRPSTTTIRAPSAVELRKKQYERTVGANPHYTLIKADKSTDPFVARSSSAAATASTSPFRACIVVRLILVVSVTIFLASVTTLPSTAEASVGRFRFILSE